MTASLDWLLEPDNPGVRYLAFRDLVGLSTHDPTLIQAREQAHIAGSIATILGHMEPEGYWCEPGAGYRPKYTGTVWSLISLAQLGAQATMDARIRTACAYLLDHALTPKGQFTLGSGSSYAGIDCLQGNLCAALLDLGFEDARLPAAYEWMARAVTGEGVAPAADKHAALRFTAAKCGPLFACSANDRLSCAWGGAKVLLAFSKLPPAQRSPLIQKAIQQGVDFFFSLDPATAEYPRARGERPSGDWWKFGFPIFYITDLLQVVEALARLGYAHDPRLGSAWEIVRRKQNSQGAWSLEHDYADKTWVDFGPKRQPNKWVTLRALQALKYVQS